MNEIIREGLPCFRGNLHLHTTASDGQYTPEDAMALYRRLGYDFLAITDHRTVTVPDPERVPRGLTLIPGIELDVSPGGDVTHILGLGMTGPIRGYDRQKSTAQQAVDSILAAGGTAVLAHPSWSLNTPEHIASLRGISGAEVYNSVSDPPLNPERGTSDVLLDIAAKIGRPLPFLANDDTHRYADEVGRGFTMAQAEECTPECLLRAIREGHIYASQGPLFHRVAIDGGRLCVRFTPAEQVIFFSNLTWMPNRVLRGHDLTEAEWRIDPRETFIRCRVTDARGRHAWTGAIPTHD